MKPDKYQMKVIKNNSKSLLVVAGAGSGKTFTIVEKIKHLISKGINEKEILCISFTREASKSLEDKLKGTGINVKTFHSFGFDIIKKSYNVRLVNDDILRNIISKYVDKFNLYDVVIASFLEFGYGKSDFRIRNELLRNSKYKEIFIDTIYTFINLYKSNLKDFDNFYKINKSNNFKKQKRHKKFLNLVRKIYVEYEDYLESSNEIDFNDMINLARKVIHDEGVFPYKYIIIDEYQDTSLNKCLLIKEIINKCGAKLMVVGDDWQSIYGFTGSNLDIFTNFKRYFKGSRVIKLKNTYRSSNELVKVSRGFIMKNPYQLRKNIVSKKHLNKPIYVYYYDNDIKEIWDKIDSDNAFVLGRNNKDIKLIPYLKDNMRFLTVHKSKGLESDDVIVVGLENKIDGFPSKVKDSEYLMYVKGECDKYLFAEERRLFYVALTRARNRVIVLVKKDNPSIFVTEILKDFSKYIKIVEN